MISGAPRTWSPLQMQSLVREAAAVSAAVEGAALERAKRHRLSLATLHVEPGQMHDAALFLLQPPAPGPPPALGGASHEADAPWQTPRSSGQERDRSGRAVLADSAASMPQQRPWHDGRVGAWRSSPQGSPHRWAFDQMQHRPELSAQAVPDAEGSPDRWAFGQRHQHQHHQEPSAPDAEDLPEPRQPKHPKPSPGPGVGARPQPPPDALHRPRHPAASPAECSAGAEGDATPDPSSTLA